MIYAGGQLTILESVDSTNNYAMARARTGLAKHGDACFAREQTVGKGQRGRSWATEPGTNIITSLTVKPNDWFFQRQFLFSVAVSLGVYDFFSKYAGDETTVKWPNDIYWRDRKAGGILIESIVGSWEPSVNNPADQQSLMTPPPPAPDSRLMSPNSEIVTPDSRLQTPDSRLPTNSWRWAIVGMGININQTVFPATIRNPVSLKQITGKSRDVTELTAELCERVLGRCEQVDTEINWLAEYNSHLYKKDRLAKLKKGNRVFEARVKEVNSKGQLLVDTGIEEEFSFGEIEWLL